MKKILISTLLTLLLQSIVNAAIEPNKVAVIYNTQSEASKDLAEFYIKMRGIPKENLVGIDLPDREQITREDYNSKLRDPLRNIFTKRGWWTIARNAQGVRLPSSSKITTLVCMRGIPFKIKRSAIQEKNPPKLPAHFAKHNEASVDSELALLGAHGISTLGPQQNPYFKKDTSFSKSGLSYSHNRSLVPQTARCIGNDRSQQAIQTLLQRRNLIGV